MLLLVIAFYLSVLTYYLGVLFHMLPIPFYGVKKWGPQLMIDGVFSAILVFSYSFIQWLIKYFGGVLGVSWERYDAWLVTEVNIVLSTIVLLKVFGMGLSSIGLNFLANSLISPLISSLTYLLIFILTVSMLVTMIYTLSPTLLALGIVLHSFPFRLARSSGATLLAVTIVFSIATPLLPNFIETISISSTNILHKLGYGYIPAYIHVYDTTGKPVPYYLYEIYSIENNTLLARYLGDENGFVNASSIYKGIPSTKHRVVISLAGYIYNTVYEPRNTSKTITEISIKLSNLYIVKPLRFVALFNSIEHKLVKRDIDYVILDIRVYTKSRIIVVMPRNDGSAVYVNGSYRVPDKTYSYSWGYIDFTAKEYWFSPGYYHLLIYIRSPSTVKPDFEEIYYARDTLKIDYNKPFSLIYPVTLLIFQLFIAPVIFYSILFSVSMALSKLLGGSSPKIARVLVSGI